MGCLDCIRLSLKRTQRVYFIDEHLGAAQGDKFRCFPRSYLIGGRNRPATAAGLVHRANHADAIVGSRAAAPWAHRHTLIAHLADWRCARAKTYVRARAVAPRTGGRYG